MDELDVIGHSSPKNVEFILATPASARPSHRAESAAWLLG
jgi:hypothetical protein